MDDRYRDDDPASLRAPCGIQRRRSPRRPRSPTARRQRADARRRRPMNGERCSSGTATAESPPRAVHPEFRPPAPADGSGRRPCLSRARPARPPASAQSGNEARSRHSALGTSGAPRAEPIDRPTLTDAPRRTEHPDPTGNPAHPGGLFREAPRATRPRQRPHPSAKQPTRHVPAQAQGRGPERVLGGPLSGRTPAASSRALLGDPRSSTRAGSPGPRLGR